MVEELRAQSENGVCVAGAKFWMPGVQEHLQGLLRAVWEDDSTLIFLGLMNLIDELERLVQGKVEVRHSGVRKASRFRDSATPVRHVTY